MGVAGRHTNITHRRCPSTTTHKNHTKPPFHPPTCVRITPIRQEYLELLQKEDPVQFMPQEYVMAGRVAILLRGLGYALKYRCVWCVCVCLDVGWIRRGRLGTAVAASVLLIKR